MTTSRQADDRPIDEMRNLGPACARDLNAAGIFTAAELKALEPETAFVKMLYARKKQGRSAKACNGGYLYALYGEIYNALGQQVRTLVDGDQVAGQQVAIWDGRDAAGRRLASGVYVYRLTSAQGVLTRKMVLLR
ncbi:MAG: FlgD immunoglobulin-like domain containing protein [Candidatus Latescibacterota bacterium]|jgi:hypothetical protein|nr:FlgD immunoglobulin-like domain containing protein [Candidatus Latescibacterota bacterium]MEC8991309.1 FlgD immunoglobulin-like domain containing protein [Candidatus Latescibacterota bacterium]MED5416155.1 FlgD immunoglobulin-like domain containing protein [Candidatus Latescibacterota bacterium]MEE3336593.1 FlgD immunoglobulin-like domain containing protein [Candidatus Latescibacterota bacterium]